jgi:hypothetical protein
MSVSPAQGVKATRVEVSTDEHRCGIDSFFHQQYKHRCGIDSLFHQQ